MKFGASHWLPGAALCALSTLQALPASAQGVAQPSHAAERPIVLAPVFSGDELVALPETNWPTNGGNSYNQRYSPLTQINRFNLQDLKALWRSGMGSGAEYKHGGQAQILHHEGTLYIANGVNDVFAMDVLSGNILWKHAGTTHPRSGNPIGWVSRGVALGEGKVFMAQIDARMKALDQRTGEVLWDIMAEDWEKGFSITSAPLYYNGLVVTGFSGGELGVRGRVKAYDAKTGWAYILNRVTGEPLIGIEDRPVMQEPRQATAATQPFPIGDAIIPQHIDYAPERTKVVNEGRIFTPFWTELVAMRPGTMGGANWPPSSYNLETNHLYVCASDRISTFRVQDPLSPPGDNVVYIGGNFAQAPVDDRGIIAAVDMTTNRLVWTREWREICFNGSTATAGGLIFIGRSDGRMTALDTRNGDQLWEFMTDAGVHASPTIFEYQGTQYVVVHAGGTAFAGSERGDGIWMFSLDGQMEQVVSAPASGGGGPRGPVTVSANLVANMDNGSTIWDNACAACHGEQGQGGHGGGSDIRNTALSLSQIMLVVNAGRNTMPAFAGFSEQELLDISTYVHDELK